MSGVVEGNVEWSKKRPAPLVADLPRRREEWLQRCLAACDDSDLERRLYATVPSGWLRRYMKMLPDVTRHNCRFYACFHLKDMIGLH